MSKRTWWQQELVYLSHSLPGQLRASAGGHRIKYTCSLSYIEREGFPTTTISCYVGPVV